MPPATPSAPPAASVSTTGDTVTVGCKLPHGIRISLVNASGNITNVKLQGANQGHVPGQPSIPSGAAGLTHGVPKDAFEAWLKAHAEMPYVKNGLIFARAQAASVQSIIKERVDERHGQEALDPAKITAGVEPLKADD